MLSRRNLMGGIGGAGVVWLGARAWLPAGSGGRALAPHGCGALFAVCSELCCPDVIGLACLRALSADSGSIEKLAQLILRDLSAAGADCLSASALRRAVKVRSSNDFHDGRIATVDGWLLSLTETRVYALAMLLAAAQSPRYG